MKRILALLLVIVMVCGLLATVAFASGDVVSPESDNTNVTGKDTSPQTGEPVSIGLVLVAAVFLCGAAAITLKKAAVC